MTIRRRRRTPTQFAVVIALVAPAAGMAGACASDPTAAPEVSESTASVPNASVAVGSTTPPSTEPPVPTSSSTDTAPLSTVVVSRYDFSALDPIVQAFVDERGLNGAGLVVVDRDDGIVHQDYWGEFTPGRVSLVASASKMLVAGVLMRLDDRGLLDVDAPVGEAVEWVGGDPTITPAQLVSNSSGLVGLLPELGYRPYACQFRPVGTLGDCGAQIFTTSDDDGDVIEPDSEFRYGGGQWQVAGALAEEVSAKSWAELIEETYVEPCGVASLGFNNHWTQLGAQGFGYPPGFDGDPAVLTPTDNPNIEGGAYVTAPDYAALLLMHLRDGRCGDTQVLSPEAVARMHTDRIGEVYGGSANGEGYGLGWFVDRTTGRIRDPGAYGAVPWLDLAEGFGAFLVIEADTTTGLELVALLDAPIAAAIAAAR